MDKTESNENKGHRQRLKKRFLENDRSALAEHELLELMLFFAIPLKDTKPLAKDLLHRYKNIKTIISTPPEELVAIDGIGDSVATLLKLFNEVNLHILETKLKDKKNAIASPAELIPYLKACFSAETKETFAVAALDSRNQILNTKPLKQQQGTVDQAPVYPREIAEYALNLKATRIIIAHNHPSGHASPSPADQQITKVIKDSLKLLGIELLDHIIIAGDTYYSFQENNQL
jgi:DNA repair protein RadC